MLRLTDIAVDNLRGISNGPKIPLRPITILVGKNSAGKSTFARFLPLLRQSTESIRKSPVLWFGPLVDFGSFDDACNRNSPDGPIKFDFWFRHEGGQGEAKNRRLFVGESVRQLYENGCPLKASICIKQGKDGTYLSRIAITVGDVTAEIDFDQFGLVEKIACGHLKWEPSEKQICIGKEGAFFPSLVFLRQVNTPDSPNIQFERIQRPLSHHVQTALQPLVHGNALPSTVLDIAKRLPLGTSDALFSALKETLSRRKLTHYLSKHTPNSKMIRQLSAALLMSRLNTVLDGIEEDLSSFLSGVRYLAPLRATAQRYYRQQELAVDEIDPIGANIANVLSSLTTNEKNELNQWTEKYLRFSVQSVPSGGHVSIGITPTGSDHPTNLADMGSGFSQVLPIPVQLWLSEKISKGDTRRAKLAKNTSCIVIEQPELHLHPDFQSRLADLFAAATKTEGMSPGLIIETHSPALVNRLGELIYQGTLLPEDVQVLLFEYSNTLSQSTLRAVSFDSKGILKEWPVGFFEPDYD
jgi:hypothetical protein